MSKGQKMRYGLACLMAGFAFAGIAHAQDTHSWEGRFPKKTEDDRPVEWEGADAPGKSAAKVLRGTEMPPASADLPGLLGLGHKVVGVVPWGNPKTSMVYLVGDRGLTACIVQFADSPEKLHQLNQCFELRR